MTLEVFEQTIKQIKEIDSFVDNMCELGIQLFDSTVYTNMCKIVETMFTELYGEEGYKTIFYYLYEQACNEDGMQFESVDELYKYLNSKFIQDKDFSNDTYDYADIN